MMKRKYEKLNDGDAFRLNLNDTDLRFACCDCGNVHIFQFSHIIDNIWDFIMFSQRRSTAQLRKHNYGYLQSGKDKKYILKRKKKING